MSFLQPENNDPELACMDVTGPVYPSNGGQKDDPDAFYGGHTPTGFIPTKNEPRPAASSRLLYPHCTLGSVKVL